MTTRCLFHCQMIGYADSTIYEKDADGNPKKDEGGNYVSRKFKQPTVELRPVMATDEHPESKVFWEATPMGSIQLTINNPHGAEVFEVGKDYYVDFTPAT
jgi:hypothetical protein